MSKELTASGANFIAVDLKVVQRRVRRLDCGEGNEKDWLCIEEALETAVICADRIFNRLNEAAKLQLVPEQEEETTPTPVEV